MDRGVLQVDLLGTDLRDIRDIACAVKGMDGSSVDAIVEEIRPETRTLRVRAAASAAVIRMRMEDLRSVTMQGIIAEDARPNALAHVSQRKFIASDGLTLCYSDGEKTTFGPHHRAVDEDGLHLYQFFDDGRISRLFIPCEVITGQEAAAGDMLARADLLRATNHVITTPRELQVCLRLGAAMAAVAASKRPAPTRQRLAELLVREHVISEQQVHEALELRQNNPERRTGDILLEMGALSEDELNLCIAKLFGVPYVRLRDFAIPEEVAATVKAGVARRAKAVPIMAYREYLVVATNNPADVGTLDILRFATDRAILPVLATQLDIEWAIDKRYPKVDHADMLERYASIQASGTADPQAPAVTEADASDEPVVKLVNNLIAEAIQRRASDIHLRPAENHVDLIYRIDGSLVPVVAFPKSVHPSLIGRIKILGGMDISEKRLPQDGQIRFRYDESTVDLRISVMPTVVGESVVIRVLNTKAGMKPMDQLGFSSHDLTLMNEMLDKSCGLILVTGPTGSGKSTTLYSCLKQIIAKNVNVITVEDPVEYRIEGIEQVQVKTDIGYTFAKALRQILRHDPDAILIGEIRDQETAEIAIKSALTGHIVLSTLHTNNAVGAITRLRDMGVLSYLLSSTLLGAQAQRLIRTNCLSCMEEEPADTNMRRVMGVGADELFMKGKGCDDCNGTGYNGRTVAYELLAVTPRLQEKITAGATAEALLAQALDDGMVPLTQNALELARSYKTSLSEVYRVRLD